MRKIRTFVIQKYRNRVIARPQSKFGQRQKFSVMAQIKEIIAPAEVITKDAALEQHLYECIIVGDFNTLKSEQQAVADVIERTKEHLQKLQDTYERMKTANDRMRLAVGQGIIFSKEDLTYIDAQISIVTHNIAYYDARINVIDEVLQNAGDID